MVRLDHHNGLGTLQSKSLTVHPEPGQKANERLRTGFSLPIVDLLPIRSFLAQALCR